MMRTPRPFVVGVLLGGLVASLVLVLALVLGSGSDGYAALGYSDPGTVTKAGTYVLRFLVDLAGAICVGSLVYAAFFTASPPRGRLSAEGWAAVRLGGWSAGVWSASALALIPFDAADSIGVSVLDMLSPAGLVGLFSSVYGPKAWLVSAVLALVVAGCCRVVMSWRSTVALIAVAVAGLLPPVAVGNAAAGPDHDYANNALLYHVVAAALWLGVLAALVVHLRRGTGHPGIAVRRYRRFAFACWLVLAISGALTALSLVSPGQLLTTAYGRMALAKLAGLLFLGALGVLLRRRLLRADTVRRSLLRLAAVEVVLILLTIAVTMGMAQVPPPSWFGPPLEAVEVAIGYALPGAPTLVNLLTVWRLDLLLGVAALAAAVVYLLGVRRLRGRGERWPLARTAAWLGGCALVVVATSSGLGAYTPVSFSAHMTSHMMLNMLAPLLLVLGGPVTLALRALPTAPAGSPPGAREWLEAVTNSPLARVLANPGFAALLFVASYYLLYFTPLFEAAMSEHWSRMALNLFTVAVGYQFCWIVIGVDPAPREFPHLGRLGMVFAVMPFHAVFAVIMMSIESVVAENYFRTLALSWAPDLLADQRLGGVVSLVAGELALVAAQVILLIQWYRHDRFEGFDSGPLQDDDAAAYRAMLDKLKQTRST